MEYTVNSQAEFDAIPLPLAVGDIINFRYFGSVYTVPVSLGVGKIKIECFGGDSDLGDSADYGQTLYDRLTGNITSLKRGHGRGGYAGGILDLQNIDPSISNLYVVVGEGGKHIPLGDGWQYCSFGGGGASDSGNHYPSTPVGQTQHDIDHSEWWRSYGAAGASDVRLYYNPSATDYEMMSGEPSDLRQQRYQNRGTLDKGTLAVKSLKSRIIVAGGAGGAKHPVAVNINTEDYGPSGSGGLANLEGHNLDMGYNGFPTNSNKGIRIQGGQQQQVNIVSQLSNHKYRNGIFGIGGTNLQDDGRPAGTTTADGSGGAGGGGWFGGHSAHGGGSGGSSYVAGGWQHPNHPTISFPEQKRVKLDDSFTLGIGSPEQYHDLATKTNGPRDGIVRFTIVGGIVPSAHIRATRGSSSYGAKIYTEENKNSYVPADNAGKNFVKIARHNNTDFFARYSTEKTFQGGSYSNSVPVRACHRGGAGSDGPNVILQRLADIFLTDIPESIPSLTITGAITMKMGARGGWLNNGSNYRIGKDSWSPRQDCARHALTHMLTVHDTDLSEYCNPNDDYRYLRQVGNTGGQPNDGHWSGESWGPNPLTGVPQKFINMYTGYPKITYGQTLSKLEEPVTMTYPDHLQDEAWWTIALSINVEVPREAFDKHILLVRTLGWWQVQGWCECDIYAGQSLKISGDIESLDATPFVYQKSGTNYYILPK